jgi:hypothetical protein
MICAVFAPAQQKQVLAVVDMKTDGVTREEMQIINAQATAYGYVPSKQKTSQKMNQKNRTLTSVLLISSTALLAAGGTAYFFLNQTSDKNQDEPQDDDPAVPPNTSSDIPIGDAPDRTRY